MPEFLVETYESQASSHVPLLVDGIEHLRSMYLPEDEMYLHLFRAESRETVVAALARASVRYDRIVESLGEPRPREDA